MRFRYLREVSVAAALALVLLILWMKGPTFFRSATPQDIAVTGAPTLVAAVGMALVILTRQIDISIGSQFAVCGVAAGLLSKAGWPMPLVAVGTLLAGGLMGTLNAVLVTLLSLPSIVVTLATMVVLRQTLLWITEGAMIQNLPSSFQHFGLEQGTGQLLIVGIAFAVFAIFAWSLRFLAAGRAFFAVGSDAEAARLAGIRPRAIVFTAFVLMGMLTGLAALLSSIRFPSIQPGAGEGLELQVIAAVVVGGVAISGGRGTLVGVLLGVILLETIGPALTHLRIEAQWGKAVQGAIILMAVASDTLQSRQHRNVGGSLVTR